MADGAPEALVRVLAPLVAAPLGRVVSIGWSSGVHHIPSPSAPATVTAPWRGLDAAEAWETLATANVIPSEVIGDPQRAFACSSCDGNGMVHSVRRRRLVPCSDCGEACPMCDGSGEVLRPYSGDDTESCSDCGGDGCAERVSLGTFPHPATLHDVVAMASRWASVTAAEELAREVRARLPPWALFPPCERVVWRVGKFTDDIARGWPQHASNHDLGPMPWEDTVERHHRRGDRFPWWAAHVETWRDARPCPHAPMLELLRSGFGVDAFEATANYLVCPLVHAPLPPRPNP